MVREGLWSNAITLVNIIISGLVAFGFYSPLTIFLDEMTDGQYTYLLDFVVIWFLFAVTMVICRTLTGAASKTRMRFKHPIDPVGGPAIGLLAAWVLAVVRHGHAAHLSHGEGCLRRRAGQTGRCRVRVSVYFARCGLASLCPNDDIPRCTGLDRAPAS